MIVKQASQNNYHTNPNGLYNVKWCWNTSVKYGPRDVLLLHLIYFEAGCALSQGPGIAVPGAALPQNEKNSFASWLLLQPDGSLGHQGDAHGRSMRNRWMVWLLTSWLLARESINIGRMQPVTMEYLATEFLPYSTL